MAFNSLIRHEASGPWFPESVSRDLTDLRRTFDELFGSTSLWPVPAPAGRLPWVPPVESYVEKGIVHMRLAIPGLDPKDVTIEVHGGQLHVAGQRQDEKNTSQRNYLSREFFHAGFERNFTLPEGAKVDAISARYEKGVLDITVPMAERSMPRKIEIKTAEVAKTIAA